MNKKQRTVLFITAIILILMLFFPPFYTTRGRAKVKVTKGYGFILDPPVKKEYWNEEQTAISFKKDIMSDPRWSSLSAEKQQAFRDLYYTKEKKKYPKRLERDPFVDIHQLLAQVIIVTLIGGVLCLALKGENKITNKLSNQMASNETNQDSMMPKSVLEADHKNEETEKSSLENLNYSKIEPKEDSDENQKLMLKNGMSFDDKEYQYKNYRDEKHKGAISDAKVSEKSDDQIAKGDDGSNTGTTQQLIQTILGEKNRAYYESKFAKLNKEGPGFKASWNWPAFFVSCPWLLYRKMYGMFFAVCSVEFILTFISNALKESKLQLMVFFCFILLHTYLAIFANSLYLKSLGNKIENAKATIRDEKKLIEYLRYKGGVHIWVIWLCIGMPVAGILLAIVIPQFAGL